MDEIVSRYPVSFPTTRSESPLPEAELLTAPNLVTGRDLENQMESLGTVS